MIPKLKTLNLLTANSLTHRLIEAILAEEQFLISSPPPASARKCAEKLYNWVKDSTNGTEFQMFCKQLMKLLESCLPGCHSKLSSKSCAKMWEKLFKIQTSSEFKSLWDNILSHSNADSNILCYQRITDVIVEKMISC